MTRRLEAGPLIVALGALLLLVSLFLNWFTGELNAWEAFEVWDVVLFVLALVAVAAGVALATQGADVVDRRILLAAVAIAAIVVVSQIVDPPPAAFDRDPDTGAWLALGAAVAMCVGALLTFGRVHVALTVEGREARHRVSVVDARGTKDPVTGSHAPVTGTPAPGARPAAAPDAPQPPAGTPGAGTEPREAKQD
jgi:hypothetical protein